MTTPVRARVPICLCALLSSACFTPSDLGDPEDTSGTGTTDAVEDGTTIADGTPLEDGDSTTAGATPMDDGPSQDETGTGTGEDGEPGDETASTTDDPAPACTDDASCVPEPPDGWSGPVALYLGTEPAPPCPAAFPSVALTGGLDPVAPPASCECSCGDATGFDCSVTVTEAGNACGAIVFDPDQWVLDSGECQLVSTADNAFSAGAPTLDVSGASCEPSASESIARASWGSQAQACTAASAGACADGTCIGQLGESYGQMCIYAGGDVECPAGDFTEREVIYAGFTDTRDCSACTCGTPSGTCGGSVSYIGGCTGLTVFYGSHAAPGCGEALADPSALRYTAAANVECAPGGGAPVGDVTPTGATTMCCLP